MDKPLTISSLQAHGVSQLVLYCRGKRKGDWPCHHSAELPLNRFGADELLGDIEQRYRCTACGWRRADLRPDYSKQSQSVGWIMPPRACVLASKAHHKEQEDDGQECDP